MTMEESPLVMLRWVKSKKNEAGPIVSRLLFDNTPVFL